MVVRYVLVPSVSTVGRRHHHHKTDALDSAVHLNELHGRSAPFPTNQKYLTTVTLAVL